MDQINTTRLNSCSLKEFIMLTIISGGSKMFYLHCLISRNCYLLASCLIRTFGILRGINFWNTFLLSRMNEIIFWFLDVMPRDENMAKVWWMCKEIKKLTMKSYWIWVLYCLICTYMFILIPTSLVEYWTTLFKSIKKIILIIFMIKNAWQYAVARGL